MLIFREGRKLKLNNNDFILKIVAELEQKGIKTGFDKLKKELEKDPAKIDVILDTSGTVGKTKGSIKKLAAELHNELCVEINKLQKQGQDINFDLSVGDVEEVIQNVINHTKKLGESFDAASDKAQKFLAKFNKKSGGVLINSDEFKAVQEAINGLGDTHTIEDLNKAMNTLEVTYDNMSSKLRNSGKSLNPFINAKNEMATMDKTIEGISLEFEKLATKPEDVANAIKELSTQQDKVNNYAVGTMEWADAYGHLQEMIRNVTKDISNLQKAQSAKSLQPQVDKIQLSMETGETESKIDALIAKTNQWTDVNGNVRISTQSLTAAFDNLGLAVNEYLKIPTEDNQRKLIEANEKLSIEYKKVTSEVRSMNAELAKDSAIDSLRLQYQTFYSENGKAHKRFGDQLNSAMLELSKGAEIPKHRLEELKRELLDTKSACKELGLTGQTWFQNLGEKIKQLSTYLSGTVIIGKMLQTGKQIVDNVSKIDASLVELEKVSDLTADGIEKVTDKSFELGKSLAKTGTDVLDAVTTFKRAGYDIADSMSYAEQALKTTNISENLKDAGQAADSLVNIMKGFKNETPEFATKINDAVNQVSNTEAVDFDNLIDGATRLSAVADQAGMSFEQMLGTLTGGYEILGNMEKVATGQITIFSRLQAIQLEGEEEVSTVAKLQETFNNATKGAVNIVDQTTGQLRNVFDILDDVANVWDKLDKNTREALAIEASGIRQKNVFLSLMQNWDGVKDAVESASNSFGSADEENEKYIKSIQGRVENFERSVQQLSRTVLDSGLVKFFVDLGTTGVNALDSLIDKLGSLGTVGLGAGLFAGVKNTGKCRMSVRISKNVFCFEYALHA